MNKKVLVILGLSISLCALSILAGDINNKYYNEYKTELVDATTKVYDILKEEAKKLDSTQLNQLKTNLLSKWDQLQKSLQNYAKPGSTGHAMTMSTLATKIYNEIKDNFKAVKNAPATTNQEKTYRDQNAYDFLDRVKAEIKVFEKPTR